MCVCIANKHMSLIYFLSKRIMQWFLYTPHAVIYFFTSMFPIFEFPAYAGDLVTVVAVVTGIAVEAKTKWFVNFPFC